MNEDAAECLVSTVSARMTSHDVANIHTIYLQGIQERTPSERWELADISRCSLHLNSLRLLVPEVLCGKMPPLCSYQD